jgi:sugar (pentulose or hexulose) kinase
VSSIGTTRPLATDCGGEPDVSEHELVVAVDLSTTACKALAFDAQGDVVASARVPLKTTSPQPGWREQSSDEWWRATCEVLREVSQGHAPKAIAIAHQRESFVCLDTKGRPLRPAILWIDDRATSQVKALGSERIHELTGRPPSTAPTFYKLAWMHEHEPEILHRTARIAEVHAYLVERLTGEWATSWASADPTGLVDVRTFGYADELLELAGVRRQQLPSLVAPGRIIGGVSEAAAAETGLPAGTPVVAGAGDGQSAGLGAGVCHSGMAYLNLGTAVTLGVHADRYMTGQAYRSMASPIAGRWTFEAALASGVHALDWFRHRILGDTSDAALAQLEADAATVPAGADGLLFLPYLIRAEAPHWDPDARGAWVGLREHHGLPHLYRAALEGIAYEQLLVLSMIEADTGVAAERVRLMGGGARSTLWVRLLADIFERPVEVTDHAETTALGAAVLAAAAVGLEGESDVVATAGRMSQGWRRITPRTADRARYRALAATYRELYPALAGIFGMLTSSGGSRPTATFRSRRSRRGPGA